MPESVFCSGTNPRLYFLLSVGQRILCLNSARFLIYRSEIVIKVQSLYLGVVINFLGQSLTDREADALVLGVYLENLHADNLSDLNRILHLLNAAQCTLGDVNQTIQTGLKLHEGAKGGYTDNLALDDGTYRILLLGVVPRLRGQFLERQLNALPGSPDPG